MGGTRLTLLCSLCDGFVPLGNPPTACKASIIVEKNICSRAIPSLLEKSELRLYFCLVAKISVDKAKRRRDSVRRATVILEIL